MRSFLVVSTLLLLVASGPAGAGERVKSSKNEKKGKLTLVAPKDRETFKRPHLNFGPSSSTLVDSQSWVNELAHLGADALVDTDLERYIRSSTAGAAPQSAEGNVSAVRLGEQREGVYARLTDNAPRPGELALFSQGVRLQGNRVLLFTLFSNEKDGLFPRGPLRFFSSVKFEQ